MSVELLFGTQLVYSVVFQNWHLYSLHTWRTEKAHFVLLLLRLATLAIAEPAASWGMRSAEVRGGLQTAAGVTIFLLFTGPADVDYFRFVPAAA